MQEKNGGRIKAGSARSRAHMTFCQKCSGGAEPNVAVKTSRQRRHIATCRRGPKGSAALFAQIFKTRQRATSTRSVRAAEYRLRCDVKTSFLPKKERKKRVCGSFGSAVNSVYPEKRKRPPRNHFKQSFTQGECESII